MLRSGDFCVHDNNDNTDHFTPMHAHRVTTKYIHIHVHVCIVIQDCNNMIHVHASCYYWCWCSMFGDLIIPVDSLSISLGMGLSITLKVGVEQLRWLAVGGRSSAVRAPAAKAGDPGSIPGGFFFSSWLTNVDGMKDLWCSSTDWLLSTQIRTGRRIYGALVQFGCYQHRCEW